MFDTPHLDKYSKVFYNKTDAISYRFELLMSEEFLSKYIPVPDMNEKIDEEYYMIKEIEIV